MLHQFGHQSASAHPCSCGFLCGGSGGCGAADTFSFMFPVPGKSSTDEAFDGSNAYACAPSSSSSSCFVDCTLSLGTPSTRQTEEKASSSQNRRPSFMSSLRWDILSGSKKSASTNDPNGGGSAGAGSSLGGEPLLLARRCANCDTTSTPLWRNGPKGPKSLCNACGIRYKKEERRAAASTITMSSSSASAEQVVGYGYQRTQPSPWGCYPASSTRSDASVSVYDEMADGGDAPFLAWRLNVAPPTPQFPVRDRHSIFQYN